MFEIYNNTIKLTRGDSAVIDLTLKGYELQDEDVVVLTIKKDVNTTTSILQKTLDNDLMQFTLSHDDTKNITYGNYVYDVQITTSNGQVYTVITPHTFKLEAEVTF